RRSSRAARVGMCASRTIWSINAAMGRSSTEIPQNHAHGRRDGFPLLPFRLRLLAPLGRQAVGLAPSAPLTVPPFGFEQTASLHLVKGRIDRSFLHLKRPSTPAFSLLQNLVGVHGAFVEQRKDQYRYGAGQELAVIIHLHL